MAELKLYDFPSPLKGYEGLEPLPEAANGKTIVNPQTGVKSKAYDRFVAPLTNGNRGAFDVHIYWFQNNPDQTKFATELWERIRREFPELRIYRLIDHPIGPHTTAMFEVNIHTPAQFGAFIPWLVIHRGPLSALIHPNTDTGAEVDEEVDGDGDGNGEGIRNHTQRATWMGERIPLDFGIFKRMREASAPGGQ